MPVTIFHNPGCSKSRATLELLRSNGIEPHIREYLSDPPSTQEIGHILELLGVSAKDLVRHKEPAYTQACLDTSLQTEDELIQAMRDHPILIERPIVLANGKAAIGRPPENVLEIL